MPLRPADRRVLQLELLESRRVLATDHLVHLAYVIPSNRSPQKDGVATMQSSIMTAQRWFADQMSRYGFGERTFRYETMPDGITPKVHVVRSSQDDSYFREDLWGRTETAVREAGFPIAEPGNVWWTVCEAHLMKPDGSIVGGIALGGGGGGSGSDPGIAIIGSNGLAMMSPADLANDVPYDGRIDPTVGPFPLKQDVSYVWFEGRTFSSVGSAWLGAMMHELTHAFGQNHTFMNDGNANGNLMGNGLRGMRGWINPEKFPDNDTYLAYSNALALNYSRYFATTGSFPNNTPPTVSISTQSPASPNNGTIVLGYSATDSSGLRAAQLVLNGDIVEQQSLSGTTITTTFRTERFKLGERNNFEVFVWDAQGNRGRAMLELFIPNSTANTSPQPFVTTPNTTVRPGSPVAFDAFWTVDDKDGLRVEWDLDGNGVFEVGPRSTLSITTSYAMPGIRLVRARVTDAHGVKSVSEALPIRVAKSNTAPVLALSGSTDYREDSVAVVIASDATLSDATSSNFNLGSLKVRITSNAQASDRLSLRHQGDAAGQIGVSGNTVSFGGVVIGSVAGGLGSTTLGVRFNQHATAGAVQAVLRNVTFRAAANEPSPLPRTVGFVVNDGDGGTSAWRSRTVNVLLVNDAPRLTGVGTVNYQLGAPPVLIASNVAVTDADSPDFAGGSLAVHVASGGHWGNRIEIGGQFNISESDGSLKIWLSGKLIGSMQADSGKGHTALSVSFTSNATVDVSRQLIRSLRFRTVAGSAGERRLDFTISDGDGKTSNVLSRSVLVTN
jgi:hypothetical protein